MPATLKSRIPAIAAAIPLKVGAAVREGVEDMAEEAKTAAPDPAPYGEYLKDSIEARAGEFSYGARSRFGGVASEHGFEAPRGRSIASETAYGIWAAWYWHFVEFGTSHSAAQPFIMPAAEAGMVRTTANVTAALRGL